MPPTVALTCRKSVSHLPALVTSGLLGALMGLWVAGK